MMQLIARMFTRSLLPPAALMLSACALLPPPIPNQGTAQSGEVAARNGDHAQAAADYERAATGSAGAAQIDLQLSAAREWLAASRPAEAARILGVITGALSSAESLERALLGAQTSLAQDRPQEAWQQLTVIPDTLAAMAAERVESLRLRVAFAASRPVDGVLAEMAAERATTDAAQRSQLRQQLLNALRAARARGVHLDPQASADPTVRGWLDLGLMAQNGGSSLNGEITAAQWRARHPNHPATEVLAQAFPAPLAASSPGTRVALLLPLTGPNAGQASTVRDGFLSAYYQLAPGARPDLKVYDTGTMAVTDALAQARAAGSSFVVGPLLREDVAAVAALGNASAPILALNFLPTNQAGPGNFYQFALSPEDEAQMAAERILADGHRRGIAIVPRGEWGSRVMDAFTRALTKGGGSLITEASYNSADYNYADELRTALHIGDSEARSQRLQSILGTKLDFEPRHRADIGFVFVVPATATNARLIDVELKAAYAGDIPSYSVSNAYEPDSTDSNRDGAGLMYPDMPWMIEGDGSTDAIRAGVEQAWGTRTAWRSRLFAFGYDACQLMLALSAPAHAAVQIAGLSGTLHVDADRRVQRDLTWVQINRDGRPEPLPAPAPAPEGVAAGSDTPLAP